jgi:hypothetical protein
MRPKLQGAGRWPSVDLINKAKTSVLEYLVFASNKNLAALCGNHANFIFTLVN